MKQKITLTPMAIRQLKKLKKNTPYSLSQIAEIAIDCYFDDCKADETDAIAECVPLEHIRKEAELSR